jgi:undecaprenyl-diphosphatase
MATASTSFRVRVLSKALIIGFLLAFAVVLLFAWLAEEVHEGETLRFDEYVRGIVHAHATPALTSVMRLVSSVGSPEVMTLLSIVGFLIFWRETWRRAAIVLALTFAGGGLLDTLLKVSFRRARPAAYFDYPLPHSFSFPSGHAMFAFCFFGTLASLVTARHENKWVKVFVWAAAAVLIALIGFSRIYLGVHYPTDVIGGYIAAFIWVAAVTIGDRWHRSRTERK